MSSRPIVPFNRASFVGNEWTYLQEVERSGQLAGNGKFSRLCQQEFERIVGAPTLMTSSCTAALEMAALLLEIGPGDEVIIPSFTFVSVANAFALRGAQLVFADIDERTLNIDPASVESLITERTRCIVAVHYAGVACDMDRILELATASDLSVVEDVAHGPFCKYKGRPLGTIGDLATLSFHATKNLSCGEGGALMVNSSDLLEEARIVHEKGTNREMFEAGRVDKYTWVGLGSSYVLSEISAAILYAQLEAWKVVQDRRRVLWERYADALADWAASAGAVLPTVPDYAEPSHHLFHVVMPDQDARDALLQHLRSNGIVAAFHYVPLHNSPMGQRMGGQTGQCPVSETLSAGLLRLPLYYSLGSAEQDRVVSAVTAF